MPREVSKGKLTTRRYSEEEKAAAVRMVRALRQGLLDEHVGHCVANAAAAGGQNKAFDMVTEATPAIARITT